MAEENKKKVKYWELVFNIFIDLFASSALCFGVMNMIFCFKPWDSIISIDLVLPIVAAIILLIGKAALDICSISKSNKNKFFKWYKKNIKVVSYIIFAIGFAMLAYKKDIVISYDKAKSYITIEWGIFAIIFAFTFMLISLMFNKMYTHKIFNVNSTIDKVNLFINKQSRLFTNWLLDIIYPNIFYLGLNVILLIIATSCVYPIDGIEYGTIGQLFVNLSMYDTILNFIEISICIFSVISRTKEANKGIHEEMNMLEDSILASQKVNSILAKDILDDDNKLKLKNANDEVDKNLDDFVDEMIKRFNELDE